MSYPYYQIIEVTDAGPYVTRLVLCMPCPVDADGPDPAAFSVCVEIREKDGTLIHLPRFPRKPEPLLPNRAYRPVTAAYPSDPEGKRISGPSRYVTLEMPYGPMWDCSSALVPDHTGLNGHGRYILHDYRITALAPVGPGEDLTGLVFDRCAGVLNRKTERFQAGQSSHPEHPIRYGYFVPRRLDTPKPLIVYLHGAGEGGQDLPVVYSGHKVTELTEERIQDLFGGAFVLVPQCDTMWMDDGSGQYGDSGNSMYTEALRALIEEFMARFRCAIDPDRVYLGGDSNGGFMTIRMLRSFPELFAAAFPVCEAMPDKRITEAEIERMKDIPIWFTHAKNDPVVNPEETVVPTWRRLLAAGARDCHFTFWDRIVDMHGLFTGADGEPYEYVGHFAWIPVLNDDCRLDITGQPVLCEGHPVTLMQWLSR
ncbi:MAG: prolyl oligopeptidase family serine peptidase, partial [Clostridia bacterium]|nr:prolyl oligopeptidase family serine peptidase [Clostridia bacterium]